MRKKGFETDLSISVLLTVPDNGAHKEKAQKYLAENYGNFQPIFLNEDEENFPIALIRELIKQTSFSRTSNEKTAYVLCGMDKASLPAQNALLKVLEEPPTNILIVLVATQGHQLLPTISSRCKEVSLNKDIENNLELENHLKETLEFCLSPQKKSHHQLIDLAEAWKKDEQKEKNISLVIEKLLTKPPKMIFALDKLREALDSWKKNGNVKLVTEHCFFEIKKYY
jgi:DNA polymerase III subunit delta'